MRIVVGDGRCRNLVFDARDFDFRRTSDEC